MEKIKKLLSTIPVAQTQVENVVEGRDIDLHITREAFQALVEPEVARFRALVAQALEAAGVGQGGPGELAAVEITGGAMRMPALQEAVAQAAGFMAKPLGLKLDDNAVAYGAALLLAGGPVGAPVGLAAAATAAAAVVVAENDGNGSEAPAAAGPSLLLRGPGGTLGAERVAALAAEEAARRAQDEVLHALAGVKNELESFVLELRGMAGHGKHGALVDGAKVGAYAAGLEEWLYSDEADAASLAGRCVWLGAWRWSMTVDMEANDLQYINRRRRPRQAGGGARRGGWAVPVVLRCGGQGQGGLREGAGRVSLLVGLWLLTWFFQN